MIDAAVTRKRRSQQLKHPAAHHSAPPAQAQGGARKRQRRLTAAQRLAPGQPSMYEAARKLEEHAMACKVQMAALRACRDSQQRPALAECPQSDDDDDDDDDQAAPQYRSAGPSIKVAPGKRIKWRGAIHEDDLVIRNLNSMFRQAQPAGCGRG